LFWQEARAAAERTFWTAGKQQADQDRDDGDNHQQFDEGNPRRRMNM